MRVPTPFQSALRKSLLASATTAAMSLPLWDACGQEAPPVYRTNPAAAGAQAQAAGPQSSAPKSAVQQQLEALYERDGRPLPQMINPQQLATPAQQPAQTATPPGPAPASTTERIQESASSATKGVKGFFDRLIGGLRRGSVPERPPQDPGMDYPKVSEQGRTPFIPPATISQGNQGQPRRTLQPAPPSVPPVASSPAQGSTGQPPLVPPAATPAETPTSQPRLFPGLAAEQHPISKPATSTASTTTATPKPQELPGLKAMFNASRGDEPANTPHPLVTPEIAAKPAPEATKSPAPAEPAAEAKPAETRVAELPVLDFNAPAPTAEPSAPAVAMPATSEPKPEQAEPSSIVPAEPAPIAKSDDPLANAFPEMPEEEADNGGSPYTGLTLEDDLFVRQTPAPAAAEPTEAEMPLPPDTPMAEPAPSLAAQEPAPAPMPEAEKTPAPAEPSAPAETAAAAEPTKVATLPETPKAAADAQPMPELKFEKPRMELAAPPLPPADRDAVASTETQKPAPESTSAPSLSSTEANLPILKPTPPASAPPATKESSRPNSRESKLSLIAARKGQKGLKGFCPVVLRDHRDLVDAREDYQAEFNGKTYSFSSFEAMQIFAHSPEKYAPAARGNDVIHLALTGESLEGSLDHAVWYKGRLYLFASAETMETFVAAPSSHRTDD